VLFRSARAAAAAVPDEAPQVAPDDAEATP